MGLLGPVRVRSGVSIDVLRFARKVKIAGRITTSHSRLHARGTLRIIARIAVVVLLGTSIIAITLRGSVNTGLDPCQATFGTVASQH